MIGKKGISQILIVILWISLTTLFLINTWWCLFVSTYPNDRVGMWWLITLIMYLFGASLAHMGLNEWGDN